MPPKVVAEHELLQLVKSCPFEQYAGAAGCYFDEAEWPDSKWRTRLTFVLMSVLLNLSSLLEDNIILARSLLRSTIIHDIILNTRQ